MLFCLEKVTNIIVLSNIIAQGIAFGLRRDRQMIILAPRLP